MLNIGGVEVGGTNPCRMVAEISNAHNGDLQRAFRLIEAAKHCGADFVKFQCYTPDELVALRGEGKAPGEWGEQGWSMRSLYEKAQTQLDWFPSLFKHAEFVGIVAFSSVFGEESLRVLRAVDCPAYKIARLDNQSLQLATIARMAGKPVLVSSSGEKVPRIGAKPVDGLLYCPPGYPTAPADVHLPEFGDRSDGGQWENWLGLSSHCLDAALPVAAVSRGAKLLEYHFMLDDQPSELESNISLYADDFDAMVSDVRRTEALLA